MRRGPPGRGSPWALTMCRATALPRWVTGTPPAAGPAIDEVTPGTTWTGTPAARQASTSSPPRPSTKGSPPLRRATRLPASAFDTRSSSMPDWRRECAPGRLPTSITSTPAPSCSVSPVGPRRSATTTSACRSRVRPRTVMRSGAPGPPPMRATDPGSSTEADRASSRTGRAEVMTDSRSGQGRAGQGRGSRTLRASARGGGGGAVLRRGLSGIRVRSVLGVPGGPGA